MKLGIYWKYATRSLLRGGQRSVLAIFCIAVGVMAIVALQLVGNSINQALTTNVRETNGGDISLAVATAPLKASDLTIITTLEQQGQITNYATAYSVNGQVTLDNGDVVDPTLIGVSSAFPLVGDATYLQPSGTLDTHQLLTGQNVIVDSGTYDALNAHIGDTFTVKTKDNRLVPVTIAGEYQSSNGFSSGSMYVAAATLDAQKDVSGNVVAPTYTTVYMTVPTANIDSVKSTLTKQFPSATITTANDRLKQRQSQVSQIRLFLQAVGLLALFIGGIGIINTMQVLLRRRRVEIAMLKTAGYSQFDLFGFFGLEAALLGLLGGAVGTALALLASGLVDRVVESAFQVQLSLIFDGFTIGSGVLIGLSTALIFGILPIVQASQVRPIAVLRESSENSGKNSWVLTIALLIVLLALFIGLAATIINNLLTALFIVTGGLIILGGLAAGLGLLVVAIAQLPIYERPSPKMMLWILGALVSVVGAAIVLAIVSVIGNIVLPAIGSQVGGAFNNVVSYARIGLTGFGIILLGGTGVFLVLTIIDAVVMFLPLAWKTPLKLAFRNIGRQRFRTTLTLTALFVGVFAIGMVVLVGQGISSAINNVVSSALQYNVQITTSVSEGQKVVDAIPSLPGLKSATYTENTVLTRVRAKE